VRFGKHPLAVLSIQPAGSQQDRTVRDSPSLVLLWVTQTDFGGLAGVVTVSVLAVSMTHVVSPGTLTGVLDGFPHLAGSASGFASFVRFTMGAAGTASLGIFNDGTPRSFGVATVVFSVIGLVAATAARPPAFKRRN